MTRRLKRFVSFLLPRSVSAFLAVSIFHIFEGVCVIKYSSGGKVMIICLLLKEAHILEHRRDWFVLLLGMGRKKVEESVSMWHMCVFVCNYWIKETFIWGILFLKVCSIIVPFFNKLQKYAKRADYQTDFPILPCEFVAGDLTLLFYLFFSNDGYWSGSKAAEGNWLRNSSMVKEEEFPLGPLTGAVCFIWISHSIRGHLPSHYYCQTLYCGGMLSSMDVQW